MDPWELGAAGERYVAGELAARGIPVVGGGPADLLIYGDTPIEVKTARLTAYHRNRQPGYQFCIHRQERNGPQAEFLVLVCWNGAPQSHDCFVVPRSEIRGQRKLCIPRSPADYDGQWKKWLNDWGMLKVKESPTGRGEEN